MFRAPLLPASRQPPRPSSTERTGIPARSRVLWRRNPKCSAVSTPSAMTSKPRKQPTIMIARTVHSVPLSRPMPEMIERSILGRSTDNFRSRVRLKQPVPKSSKTTIAISALLTLERSQVTVPSTDYGHKGALHPRNVGNSRSRPRAQSRGQGCIGLATSRSTWRATTAARAVPSPRACSSCGALKTPQAVAIDNEIRAIRARDLHSVGGVCGSRWWSA